MIVHLNSKYGLPPLCGYENGDVVWFSVGEEVWDKLIPEFSEKCPDCLRIQQDKEGKKELNDDT